MFVIVITGTALPIPKRAQRLPGMEKAVRVDYRLEKMWAVVIISWIIVYVKGKKIYTYILIFFSENKVYD